MASPRSSVADNISAFAGDINPGGTLSSYVQNSLMPYTALSGAMPTELPSSISFNNDIYPKQSSQSTEQQVAGSQFNVTTPGQDAKNGTQPDYYLNAQGQLVANPKAPPHKPGSAYNVEVEGNNSAKKAEQYANQLQKKAIGQLVAMYKLSHPGAKIPEMWQSILDSQTDPSYPNTGDSQNNNTVTPEEEQAYDNPQPAPNTSSSSSNESTNNTPQDNTSASSPSSNGGSTGSAGGDGSSGGGASGGTSSGGDGGAGGSTSGGGTSGGGDGGAGGSASSGGSSSGGGASPESAGAYTGGMGPSGTAGNSGGTSGPSQFTAYDGNKSDMTADQTNILGQAMADNNTPMWDWNGNSYGGSANEGCAATISNVLIKESQSDPAIFTHSFSPNAYVPTLEQNLIAAGWHYTNTPQPGDVVAGHDWPNVSPDHVGIVGLNGTVYDNHSSTGLLSKDDLSYFSNWKKVEFLAPPDAPTVPHSHAAASSAHAASDTAHTASSTTHATASKAKHA